MPRRLTHLLTVILALLPLSLPGSDGDARTLSFFHTHTGNGLVVTYYQNGDYIPAGMQQLRHFLADWRDNKQHDLDPALMDILWQMQTKADHAGTWEVISAYRSPETNTMLNKRSNGVAKRSQHLQGKAIDVRLRGMDTKNLHQIALDLKLGGVGYYEESDFVHVDTGRVRRW